MKDNQDVYDLLRGEYQVEVVPRVYAEWNQNAFNYTECDNDVTGGEDETGYDIEIFPIRSIAQPWRPQRAGICKAVINQSATEPTAKDDATPMSRYYIVSTDDRYKYWQSPEESVSTPAPAGEYAIANCKPFVKYVEEYDEEEYDKSEDKNSFPFVAKNVKANKIQVVIETNSISIRTGYDSAGKPVYSTRSCIPKNWQIQVRYAGNTDPDVWTTIATNATVPTNPYPALATDEEKEKEGRVELWLTDPEALTWSTTRPNLGAPSEGHFVEINAVRIVVNTLSRPLASFNLIELGARLEFDVTKDVSSPDYKETLGQADFITPLGTISANDGSLTLFNGTIEEPADRIYSNENPESPLFKMLDKGVKFTCDWAYRMSTGDFEFVRAFTIYSDSWEESVSETTVSLKDAAMRLQDIKPPQVLWENIPVQEIVWRLLDICGFNDYDVSTVSVTQPSMVDIFWTTGDETLWEVLRDLASGTQTAIYFDAYGKLQVKPRTVAFNNFKDAIWTARENNYWTGSNNEVPDIITLNDDNSYEANRVDVQYQPTGFSELKNGVYPFETVWEPTSTVTLRSTPIVKDMPAYGDPNTTNAWRIWLDIDAARLWPWKGLVNIDGEWIRYEGKGFYYVKPDGTKTSKIVKSQEEADKLRAQAPADKKHMCHLSGSLMITERGAFNTGRQAHLSRPKSEWTARAKGAGGTEDARTGGFRHDKRNHRVAVEGFPHKTSSNNLRIVTHGSTLDQGYNWIGTRMQLTGGGYTDRTAGIVFNNETFTGGYYLEFMPSTKVSAKKDANYRQEVVLWSYKNNGDRKILGGEKIVVSKGEKAKGKEAKRTTKVNVGAAAAIGTDIWFDVDIRINTSGTNAGQGITVFVNGKAVLAYSIGPENEWYHPWVGRFGMFARGHSKALYEYIYGTSRNFDSSSTTDEESFVDRIRGGYAGSLSSIWQYDTKTIRKKIKKRWTKVTQRYNQIFFEEFGAIAHEIREFDVEFKNDDTGGKTDMPVLESKILNTNDTNAAVCWYTGRPGGANFAIANTSRTAAVLNGEIGDVTHSLLVYGRPVLQKDTVTITKEDLPAQRKRGTIQTDYQSKWIQNEAEAEALATWLTTSWSLSDTLLTVEVFGNPLIELTDVVDVQYRDIIAKTDDPVNGWKYYVVGINTSFSEGLKTTLTLKRVTETA